MCRSMTRRMSMGHFAHTQALVYAADPARIKRNRSLMRPLKELFMELLPEYNAAVSDNRKANQSYNENILDLLPRLEGVDLVYFDLDHFDENSLKKVNFTFRKKRYKSLADIILW